MPRKQKRYQTPEDVERDIDKAHRRLEKLKTQAQCALDAEELWRGVDVASCRIAREEADKLLGAIDRLRDTRLKKLQLALAEMRTIPLGATNGVSGLQETEVVIRRKE